MPPTPPHPSSFHSPFRFRRSRNANPFDPSHQAGPPPAVQDVASPRQREGARELDEQQHLQHEDLDIGEEERADDEQTSNIGEEGNEADEEEDEEEGGIEEGSLFTFVIVLSSKSTSIPTGISTEGK